MLDNIPVDKAILRGWLKAGYVEKRTLFATDEGTPGARTSSLGWGWTRPEDRQIARFPGRHHATLPRRLGRPRDEKDRSWKKREGPRGCPYAPSQQPIRGRPISRAFY